MELGKQTSNPRDKRPRSPHFHHCESLFLKETQGIRVIDWVRHVRDQQRDPRQLRDQHCLPAGNWQIQIGSYQIRSTQNNPLLQRSALSTAYQFKAWLFSLLLNRPPLFYFILFYFSYDFHAIMLWSFFGHGKQISYYT